MRMVLLLVVGSLMLIGTVGCGRGQDPASKPGFNKATASDPSKIAAPPPASKAMNTPGAPDAAKK